MSAKNDNLSSDLLWECTRRNNAYLCKRAQAGGVQFSRDPMNLLNVHSRKHAGFVNEKAIGIHADDNTVAMTTKLPSRQAQPARSTHTSSFAASTPSRKLYRSVVNSTARKGYRADLRGPAVSRASAIKLSQREKKATPAPKLRGAKARKAAASS